MFETRRREFISLLGGAVAWPVAARTQQSAKVARIGFLGATSLSSPVYKRNVDALRDGLRDLGYIEGQNIVIEFRWADGDYDRLPELAAEIVRLKPDVIITHGTPGTLAAKHTTTTIPIVMAVVGDAVVTGVVPSIARPGGNITGLTFFNPELGAKRLELLKEAFPRSRRVGVLVNPGNAMARAIVQAMEAPAGSLNTELQVFEARRPAEFENAFLVMAQRRVDAVTVIEDPTFIANARTIGEIASSRRLPLIGFREIVDAGGLVAYGVRWHEMYHRAAVFVDKILKGAKPGDLPIEQATRFDLVVNLKAAKALGLEIPPTLLARADEVIE
jgi:putative tryptophan/tyrosine transport system substrate-binding protein